jgi:hypothetical protein
VKAARAVRAITIASLPVSLARIEHGQTNQKFACVPGYNKKKNALENKKPLIPQGLLSVPVCCWI